MNRSSSRRNRLKFKTSQNLPIVLEEPIEYTSNERKHQNRKMSTCNRLDLESLGSWPTLYAQKLLGHYPQPTPTWSKQYSIMWVSPWPWVMYSVPLNTIRIFVYHSYIHVELGNLVGVILPAPCAWIIVVWSYIYILPTLCAWLIVHPNHICKKALFIQTISLENYFSLQYYHWKFWHYSSFCIGVSFFLFSEFRPMKVRHAGSTRCYV